MSILIKLVLPSLMFESTTQVSTNVLGNFGIYKEWRQKKGLKIQRMEQVQEC